MAVSVYTTIDLEPVTCCSCGVIFGMTTTLEKKRREDHKSFHCPNGHSQHFTGESEAEKYKRMLEAEKTHARWLRDQMDATERSLTATKGVVTKLKKRASAGVCPCCNRQFQNVKLHMGRKHPDFVTEQGTKIEEYVAP